MSRLEQKLIDKAYSLIDVPQSRFRHYTFIVKRNRPICIGWNWPQKTNPRIIKYGYRFNSIHSEAHAIFSFPYDLSELCNYKFYNIRINMQNKLALSAPCVNCAFFLRSMGVREIYHTDNNGIFEKMVL